MGIRFAQCRELLRGVAQRRRVEGDAGDMRPFVERGAHEFHGFAEGGLPVGSSPRGGSCAPAFAATFATPIAFVLTFAMAVGLAFALLVAFAAPTRTAYADETDENLVDPTQRADNSFIYDTTIESLFEQSSLYEGRTVQVTGEAIGDRIVANGSEEGYWVTLTVIDSEDKSSIPVLMSVDQANQIDHFGKYGITGTILQVRGTYHQACIEHEGLSDVHATNSAVMAKGVEHPDTFTLREFVPGVIAVVIGGILMAVFYFARERTR